MKKLAGGVWQQCMFVVYDDGEVMFCNSDTGVTDCVNLDTVVAVNDVSKKQNNNRITLPSYTFELKTNEESFYLSCEAASEHQAWMDILRELSPLA